MASYERKKYLNQNSESLYLSSYRIKEAGLSFFMSDNRFTELMSNKYKKESIYKKGILFNLFLNPENENMDIKNIEKKYLEKYVDFHKEYSKTRSEITLKWNEAKTDSILSIYRDSITTIVDSLEIKKTKEVKSHGEKYNQEIFNYTVSLVKVKIDSIDYTDSLSCKYFKDQFFGMDGVLCNLFEANLPKGNKIVEFTRMRYDEDAVDSLSSKIVKIPVYIE
jgi:hypothetical protein